MAANTEYTKIKESALSALFSAIKAAFWPKADVTNITLADVAVSGSYGDLDDTPEVDSTPTENSTNLVTSGGVYAVLGDVETLINAL